MEQLSDTTLLDDAVRSAVGRARAVGEPSAVLVLRLADPGSAEALLANVRGSDVAANLGDGAFAVVLYGIGRLPAASVAERFERATGGSTVGMTLIQPWERREPTVVLHAACEDLRLRIERDAPTVHLAAA